MEYKVRVIADNELPEGVNWVLVREDGHLEFWLRASTASRASTLTVALEDAWGAYRGIGEDRLMSWPSEEVSSRAV